MNLMRMSLIILLICMGCPSIAAEQLFYDDFEKGEDSKIFQYLISHGHEVEIVSAKGVDKSKGLKLKYISIFKGSVRVKGFFKLAKNVTEASLSYDVLFTDDFQFQLGGKMHGVGTDFNVRAGEPLAPYNWSSRAGFKKDGKISTLLYTQNKAHKWGTAVSNDQFRFQKGRYYAVTLYTKLNTSPHHDDGEVKIFVDGKLLVHHQNILFWKSDSKNYKISEFLFSTFHGGSSIHDAPKDKKGNYMNVHAIFDNFLVSEGLKIRDQLGI